MENASKALLIAGSVLIAILLIAVGMKVFNSTSNTTDSAKTTMEATAIATFNNKFIPYIGTSKSGSQVRSLINVVMSSNAKNEHHNVNIVDNKGKAININDIDSQKYYKIEVGYDGDGYINKINIK